MWADADWDRSCKEEPWATDSRMNWTVLVIKARGPLSKIIKYAFRALDSWNFKIKTTYNKILRSSSSFRKKKMATISSYFTPDEISLSHAECFLLTSALDCQNCKFFWMLCKFRKRCSKISSKTSKTLEASIGILQVYSMDLLISSFNIGINEMGSIVGQENMVYTIKYIWWSCFDWFLIN